MWLVLENLLPLNHFQILYACFWHILCVFDVNSYCRLHEKNLLYKKNSIISAIMFTRLRTVLASLNGRLKISVNRQWETHRSSLLVIGIIYKKTGKLCHFSFVQFLGIMFKILRRYNILMFRYISVYFS